MAKSLLLFQDQKEVFDTLTDKQAGQLIKAIFQYQENGEVIKLDPMLSLVLIPIRQTMDRNTEKYENTCKRNALNISKRWEKKDTKDTTGISGIPVDTKNTNSDSNPDSNNNSKKEGECAPVLTLPLKSLPVVPQMLAMFQTVFPESFIEKEIESKPCFNLSEKIKKHFKVLDLQANNKNETAQVLKHWGELLDFSKTSKWWSSKPISFMDSKFSGLIQDYNGYKANCSKQVSEGGEIFINGIRQVKVKL